MATIEERLAVLEAAFASVRAAFVGGHQRPGSDGGAARGYSTGASGGGGPPADLADDAELDSERGNPQIRKSPGEKYWKGIDCAGRRLSECPPDFLDAFAKYKNACAYANQQNGDPAKARYIDYDLRDARRARGWAARIRAGKGAPAGRQSAPKQPPNDPGFDDYGPPAGGDDIPFAIHHDVSPRHIRTRARWEKF